MVHDPLRLRDTKSHTEEHGLHRPIRQIVRDTLLWIERQLHPIRRERALRRLRRGRPSSVLFICNGNICRSPYAAYALGRYLHRPGDAAQRVDILSAGFIGAGRRAPPEAIAEAGERGVDLSGHNSRLVTSDDVHRAAAIFVMDIRQAQELRRRFRTPAARIFMLCDLRPRLDRGRRIEDPVDQPREVFSRVYDRIDECVSALAATLIETARQA